MKRAFVFTMISVVVGSLTSACGRTIGDSDNKPPFVDAGLDQTVAVGTEVLFDGTASTDADGSIESVLWNFGDGETSDQLAVTHIFATSGSFVVSLKLTDDDGSTGVDEVIILVEEPSLEAAIEVTPPSAQALVNLTFTATSAGPSAPASAAWTFGDGGSASGLVVQHAYENPGSFHVVLTLTDDSGDSDVAEADVLVLPPDVNGSWGLSSTPATYNCGQYQAAFPDSAIQLTLANDGSATATGGNGRIYTGGLEDGQLTLTGTFILPTGGSCSAAPVTSTIRATFDGNDHLTASATAYYSLAIGCQCSAVFSLQGNRVQ